MRMGCCFSCKDDEDSQVGDSNVRTPLLRDPIGNNTPDSRRMPQRENDQRVGTENTQSRGQEDELAKILQETASAMIDVSGSGSHSLDQREFQERTRHYLQKVQSLTPALIRPRNNLLGDVPNPEKQVGAPLISKEDLDLVDWAMDEVENSLHSIKVEHNEDLVVPFGGTQQPAQVQQQQQQQQQPLVVSD